MKTRPSLLLLVLLAFVTMVATAVVFAQSGVGPFGKKLYNHANDVLVLPSGYDYTYTSAKDGTIVYDGGNLYIYVAANGKYSKVTMVTPTNTPTPTATPSSTSTATATATPTP